MKIKKKAKAEAQAKESHVKLLFFIYSLILVLHSFTHWLGKTCEIGQTGETGKTCETGARYFQHLTY